MMAQKKLRNGWFDDHQGTICGNIARPYLENSLKDEKIKKSEILTNDLCVCENCNSANLLIPSMLLISIINLFY